MQEWAEEQGERRMESRPMLNAFDPLPVSLTDYQMDFPIRPITIGKDKEFSNKIASLLLETGLRLQEPPKIQIAQKTSWGPPQ